jgi:hypothetical protein
MNDTAVNEFLNAQKPSTAHTYKRAMALYLEYTAKTGKELLEEKKADTAFKVEASMFPYKNWLINEKQLSTKTATEAVMTARSFYAFNRMPLIFRKNEANKLKEFHRKTTDYLFDKDDLGKMALVGDLKQRYVLIVGKSVGLRASDFTAFTYSTFRSLKLDSDAPIALGQINTLKESVKAFPFLDSDAIPIIKQILESNKDKADSDRVLTDTEDNLSVVLQTLALKAGIDPHGKRIRFHNLRKYLIDHLSAYASESQWKQIVGKAISESAYVSQDQLRQIFNRAMPSMLINGNGAKVKKLMELEQALIESQKQILNLTTINQTLVKKIEELESQTKTMSKSLIDLDTMMQKILSLPTVKREFAKAKEKVDF